jgi:hypothetical protein
LKAFSQFLEIIFLIFSEKNEQKMLRTPRVSSPVSTREADSGVLARLSHTQEGHGGVLAGGELAGGGGHHYRAPRDEAKPRVPRTRPDELGTKLAGVHGGAAALAHDGRPEQAVVTANEARTSTAR